MKGRNTMTEAGKIARREYLREWRKKNAERVNEYKRRWNADNPDKVKASNARYWDKRAKQTNKGKNQGKGSD